MEEINNESDRSAKLLEVLQNLTHIGGWELDLHTNELFWTAETYRIHETTPEEFDPSLNSGLHFYLPESKKLLSDALTRAMSHGEGYSLELELKTFKGRHIQVITTCEVTIFDGKPSKLIGAIQDITEQKKRENEQNKIIEQYNLAIKAGKLGLWTLDLTSGHLEWNDQHLEFYGLSRSEFEEGIDDWQKQLHPDDAEYANKELSRAFKGESFHGVEFRIFRKDGEIRYLDASAIPVYNEAKEVVKVIGMNRDITELKQAVKDLKNSEEKFSNAFENNPNPTSILNLKTGERLAVNNAFCEVFGYSKSELLDGNIYVKSLIVNQKEFKGLKEKLLKDSRLHQYPLTKTTKSGRVLHMLINATKLYPNNDNIFITSYMDVTKVTESQKQLERSDRVFNLALDMFCIAGYDGYFKYLNPAWERTLGWSTEELLTKPWIDFVHPDDQNNTDDIKSVIVDGQEVLYFENRYICKDGSVKWLTWNSQPFADENIMIGAARDVTEAKENSAKMIRNEELLNASQNIAKVGGWELDLLTKELFWTEETYHLHDTTPEAFDATVDAGIECYLPDSRKILEKALQAAIEKGEEYDLELDLKTTKGRLIQVRTTCKVLFHEGKPAKLIGTFQDITQQKQNLLELEHEKRISEILLDYSSSGIYIFDLEHGRNKYINHQYEVILGYSKEEMNAFSADESAALFHPDDREEVFRHMALVASGEKDVRLEYRFKKKDGDYVYCQSRDSAFEFTKEGKAKSFIGSFVEITEFKQLETAKNEAVKVNKLKDEFLSNMSHEIRTPLNAIIGFSRLLNDDLGIDDKEIYLDQIQGNSEQLLSLVNDLLNITKLASGNLELKNRPVNLIKLAKSIFAVHHQYIQTRHQNLKLNLNIPETDHDLFIADEIKLKEILHNLIDNAIKFTKKGTIEIGYTYHDKEVEFYVKDDGIGIPKNEWEAIFTRFSQVPGTADVYGGTGLGLAICKGLVEKMGGKIWVESKINVGSTFRFTIPKILVEQIEEETESVKIPSNKTIKRILIADDSPSVRLFYKTIMKKLNVDVQLAKNGEQAIDFYQQNSDKIDLVLMDIRMPGIGGIEAMKRIKKINHNIPVIAQTAFAMDTELENFRKLGFDDCMTKPIPEEDLFRLIRGLD